MTGPGWPDARGWIGIGSFVLTLVVLAMLALVTELRADEFFKTIATLIIGTGFINGVVNWGYGSTKSGGELADRNASIVQKQAEAPTGTDEDPMRTKEVEK